MSLSFLGDERKDFASQAVSSELTLTGDPTIKAWTAIGGVEFEALEPHTSWKLPVDANTGLLLANGGPQTTVTFDVSGTTISGAFGGTRSVALFVRELFGVSFSGTLVINSDAPIAVWATECQATCVASPVTPFGE